MSELHLYFNNMLYKCIDTRKQKNQFSRLTDDTFLVHGETSEKACYVCPIRKSKILAESLIILCFYIKVLHQHWSFLFEQSWNEYFRMIFSIRKLWKTQQNPADFQEF